jgi:hypothetical protein
MRTFENAPKVGRWAGSLADCRTTLAALCEGEFGDRFGVPFNAN